MRLIACLLALSGLALNSPALAQTNASAAEVRVLAAQGTVEIIPPDGAPPHNASAGETLGHGVRVRTASEALTRLALPNGSTLTLLPDAALMLFASPMRPPRGRPPSTTTTLEHGALHVTAAPAEASTFPLAVGMTTVNLGRAEATVSTPRGASITRVAVYQGRLLVRTGSNARAVPAGMGARESMRGARAPLLPLVAAPRWREAPSAHVASLRGAGAVSASWNVPRGAGLQGWRFELARDAAFHDIVVSARVPLAEARWQGRVQGTGDWYARVIAIDAHGVDGQPSSASRFTVEVPEVAPGAPATASDRGRAAVLRVPAGILCGVDGALPAPVPTPLRFAPARAHRVRCVSANDAGDAYEFEVPVNEAGPVRHEVRLQGTGASNRLLSLRLYDLDGYPIPYASIGVAGDPGVQVDALRETDERGVYVSTVRWQGARARVRLLFTVNGGVSFTEEITL